MIDEKIARLKSLIEQREQIDKELSELFGLTLQPKRGRPRKDTREAVQGETTGWSITHSESFSESPPQAKSGVGPVTRPGDAQTPNER